MGDPLAGVFDAVEPGTGHVLAMSVNRRYGCSTTPTASRSTSTSWPSQGSGSTYKVFTAAAALSEGFGSNYTLNVPQPYTSQVYKSNGGTRGAPLRRQQRQRRLRVDLQHDVGPDRLGQHLLRRPRGRPGQRRGPGATPPCAMGMHFDDPITQHTPALVHRATRSARSPSGPDATSPLDLASAYATVAASGTHCDPTPVTAIARPQRPAAQGRRRQARSTPATTARPTRSSPASRTRWRT